MWVCINLNESVWICINIDESAWICKDLCEFSMWRSVHLDGFVSRPWTIGENSYKRAFQQKCVTLSWKSTRARKLYCYVHGHLELEKKEWFDVLQIITQAWKICAVAQISSTCWPWPWTIDVCLNLSESVWMICTNVCKHVQICSIQ